MYIGLSPGAIGVRVQSLEEAIEAARRHGFGGVEFGAEDVAARVDRDGVDAVRALFERAAVRPAGCGLPVDWRGEEAGWRSGVEALPRLARAASAIGCDRFSTWIMPCSNERAFDANWKFHVERFRPIAQALAQGGCRLGLEFIGPKTLRDSQRFPFVHTLGAMLRLAAEIGPNAGLLLDAWHWHTSHGDLDDLRTLRPEQVVYVHVNDAPAGVETDAQVDSVRALPAETGVIDLTGFLQALRTIGYDGPVTAEPFKRELRDLPSDDARLEAVARAMREMFSRAGISPE